MGPLCHVGMTTAVLAVAKLTGHDLSLVEVIAVYIGGVLIDGDKIFEIYENKFLKKPWDITARCRILHSLLAFPFGLLLVYLAGSWLPFLALLSHIGADCLPGVSENGRYYSCHSCLKWLMLPFLKKLWYKVVFVGWPVTAASRLNEIYKLGELLGLAILVISLAFLIRDCF